MQDEESPTPNTNTNFEAAYPTWPAGRLVLAILVMVGIVVAAWWFKP